MKRRAACLSGGEAPEQAAAGCPVLRHLLSAVANAPTMPADASKGSRNGYTAPHRDGGGMLLVEEDLFYEMYAKLCDAAGEEDGELRPSKPELWGRLRQMPNTARLPSRRGGAYRFDCDVLRQYLQREGAFDASAQLPDMTPPARNATDGLSEQEIRRGAEGLPLRLLCGIVNDVEGEIKRLTAKEFYNRYTLLYRTDGYKGSKMLLPQQEFIRLMDDIPGVDMIKQMYCFDCPTIKAHLISIKRYAEDAKYPRYLF